jgi:hypothetical protein
MTHAVRALILLALGVALRDCLLLGAGVVVWSEHRSQRLDACPDRAHAWVACVLDGGALLAAGTALAAHTAAVLFGWWPRAISIDPFVTATLALAIAIGGLGQGQLKWRHGAIAVGVIAATLSRSAWAACAFAALVALAALVDGVRHLGPMSGALAASHDER